MQPASEPSGDEDDVLEPHRGVLRAVAEGAAGERRHRRPRVLIDVVLLRSGADIPILQVSNCKIQPATIDWSSQMHYVFKKADPPTSWSSSSN